VSNPPNDEEQLSQIRDGGDDEAARTELLELAITAAGVGTFDWDLVEGTLVWDDQLIDLFGYDTSTFDRSIHSFEARLHPEDLLRVREDLKSAIDNRGEFVSEYRIILPGGAVRWIGARGRTLVNKHGVPVRLLGAAWDNTVRAESEARVARVMESMTTAFFSLDTSWRFTYVNAEGEMVLGRSRDELLGGNLWDLFPKARGTNFETNYRRAMETGEHVAFDAYYPAPLDAWYEVRAWRTADGLAVYFLDVTARHRNQEMALRSQQRTVLLGRITEELASTLVLEEAAKRLADLVVPTLADWCIVTLIADTSAPGERLSLGQVTVKHADESMEPLLRDYAHARLSLLRNDAIVVRAMETGKPQFVHAGATAEVQDMFEAKDVRSLMAQLAPEAIAVMSLSGRNGVLGMLTVGNSAERGDFTPDEMVTLDHVGARAGLVMDNARLYRQQLDLAEALQRSLLSEPPQPDDVEIAVRYMPAAEAAQVGGDWYDAFMQPTGDTVLVIGDVVGHNSESAAAMSQVRTLLRGIGALGGDGPAEILRKVDKVMETLQIDTDATVVVVRLEQTPQERERGITRIRWSSAGHPPPMVINPNGSVMKLEVPDADVFLGVIPDFDRHEYELTLERGATVLLYTDGLVERRGIPLDAGLDQLDKALTSLQSCTLDELCDRVIERMRPEATDDDISIIAVRLHGQEA
jgi:PAS domain S-box-containing protein